MRFNVRFTHFPAASVCDPNFFIDKFTFDVIGFTEDIAEVLAARFAVDRIDVGRVEESGEPLWQVCDADSAEWESVFAETIELDAGVSPSEDVSPRLRDDFYALGPDAEVVSNIVLVRRILVHPQAQYLSKYMMARIAAIFPLESAIVVWNDEMLLEDFAQLGFNKIAGSSLVLKLNLTASDYDPDKDDHRADQLVLPSDNLVSERWGDEEAT